MMIEYWHGEAMLSPLVGILRGIQSIFDNDTLPYHTVVIKGYMGFAKLHISAASGQMQHYYHS